MQSKAGLSKGSHSTMLCVWGGGHVCMHMPLVDNLFVWQALLLSPSKRMAFNQVPQALTVTLSDSDMIFCACAGAACPEYHKVACPIARLSLSAAEPRLLLHGVILTVEPRTVMRHHEALASL